MGTGTSQGVPVIACDCEVCQSSDPRDNRLRTSLHLQIDDVSIGIDCGPDFRQQMLRAKVSHLDAILITHEHNDHIIGMDDVRPFNFRSRKDMLVYATESVQGQLIHRFPYVFATENRYPGAPMIKLLDLHKDQPFEIAGIKIIPIEVMHGKLPVLGFRFGNFAYITDMKTISDEEFAKLEGVTHLVVNALHHNEHFTHMNLTEALAFTERVGAKKTYFTHISHRMGLYEEVEKTLPEGVMLAYDGLRETISM